MGFKTVYRNLQEVFPQIENRLLRAVAIQHPKDSDVAVEVVLTEVIPHLAQQKLASSSSNSGGSSERKAKCHTSSPVSLRKSKKKDSYIKEIADTNAHFGRKDIVEHSILNSNMAVRKASTPVKQCSDGHTLKTKNVIQQVPIPAKESILNASKVKEPTELKDESALKPLVDGSAKIDMLEGFTEDTKNSKKTLASAVVLFTSLMKEIEIQEKEVEDVKKRSASRFLDILKRVEDLKDIMQHAKEATEMHAGEVYAEKAILDTEVRRVQTRLLNLSEEKDILDEMRCKLGERLAEAENVMNKDDVELVEKDKLVKNALAEQQLILEKAIEESKKLNLVAEENTKSSEFLMGGRIAVDTLEEEVSTISEDVKLLKGKLDEMFVESGGEPVLAKEVDLAFVLKKQSDTMKESSNSSKTRASVHDESKAIDDEWDLCQSDP